MRAALCTAFLLFAAHLSAAQIPSAKCGLDVVSYRFVGKPGSTIVYSGKTFTVPSSGVIELIAHQDVSVFRVGNREVRAAGKPDEFGTLVVILR